MAARADDVDEDFANVNIRMGFLRKVYGILTTQILVTTIVAAVFMMNKGLTNQWMLLVAFIGTIGILMALMVKRQETSTNYILLGIFTLLEGYLMGGAVTIYKMHSVIVAIVLTLSVTTALTAYTLQSKCNLNVRVAGLFSALWILIIAGYLQILYPTLMMDKAIAVGWPLFFSLYIISNTNNMMDTLGPEGYIIAAIKSYQFIFILSVWHMAQGVFQEHRN